MLCFIFLAWGGHRDKASYYKTFLIDSIMTKRRIHLGYLMMIHMIAVARAQLMYSPMVASFPKCLRMPTLTLVERQTSRPLVHMTHMMISLWGI